MADEKLDLDALERALIGSAMGFTFRECQTLIKYARALESRASNAGGAVALWQEKWAPSAEFHIRDAIAGIGNCIADPMWADHAEVPKANLKKWHKALHGANDAMKSSREHGFRDCIDAIRGAIAFGSQNTNAPPDGHWLAEFWSIGRTHPAPASKEPVADERAAFEAWAGDWFFGGVVRCGEGYAINSVNAAWYSWQARAALATAQTPEGWRLVPSKPTPEMIEAGNAVFSDGWTYALPVYANMLAAAPAKPEGV